MSLASVASSARRAVKRSFPKARKGDVFVLESTTTSTQANTFKQTTYSSFCFAIVAKVDRSGLVKEWTKLDLLGNHPVTKGERVLLINNPELQAAARDVYSVGYKFDNFFSSADKIRSLVLDRIEALR